MLTHEGLEAIKQRLAYLKANQSTTHQFCITDIDSLIEALDLISRVSGVSVNTLLSETKEMVDNWEE